VNHVSEEALEQYSMRSLPVSEIPPLEERLLICPECRDRLQTADEYAAAMKLAAAKIRESGIGDQGRSVCSRVPATQEIHPGAVEPILNLASFYAAPDTTETFLASWSGGFGARRVPVINSIEHSPYTATILSIKAGPKVSSNSMNGLACSVVCFRRERATAKSGFSRASAALSTAIIGTQE
jgi:hypothetical protein